MFHALVHAPVVNTFLDGLRFSQQDVQLLMTNSSAGQKADDIACSWVLANRERYSVPISSHSAIPCRTTHNRPPSTSDVDPVPLG